MIMFLLFALVLPFLTGSWILCFRKKPENGRQETMPFAEVYVAGIMTVFAAGEIAGCAVIKLDGDFAMYKAILGVLTAAALCISAALGGKSLRRMVAEAGQRFRSLFTEWKDRDMAQRVILLLILLFLILQIAGYFVYVPDVGGDVTAETVHATGTTGTVFQYNPVTGMKMEHGIYPIHKLASLPLLYTVVGRLTGIRTDLLLFYVIPVWILLVSFALTVNWASVLFPEQKDRRCRFLLLYMILITFGDYAEGTFAYGMLHGAWKGSVVACALAVLFGACAVYRIFAERQWLYGGIGVLLALVGIVFTRPLFAPALLFSGAGEGFHEWGLLLLAVLAVYLIRERKKQSWKKREVICLAFALLTGVAIGSPLTLLALSYTGVLLTEAVGDGRRSRLIMTGLAVIICLSGTVLPLCSDVLKRQYIPRETIEVHNRIEELTAQLEQVCLAAPEDVMEQARLMNPKICLPYGKDIWRENCNREVADIYTEAKQLLYQQMKTDYLQPDTAAVMAKEEGCNLLVLREAMSEEAMRQGGWQQAQEVTGYAVYYR